MDTISIRGEISAYPEPTSEQFEQGVEVAPRAGGVVHQRVGGDPAVLRGIDLEGQLRPGEGLLHDLLMLDGERRIVGRRAEVDRRSDPAELVVWAVGTIGLVDDDARV